MILDDGLCSIFLEVDTSEPGEVPKIELEALSVGEWYGLLNFETMPAWPTEAREEKEVSLRIRVGRDTRINSKCSVVLQEAYKVEKGMTVYEVARVYHGVDDDSGEEISDLTLRQVSA